MVYIYNARYPDDYNKPHVVFEKYDFRYEYDSSARRRGLPALCNVPVMFTMLPLVPCTLPNSVIPIRDCSYIGYGKAFEWPRVNYAVDGTLSTIDINLLYNMLGSAFVACIPSTNKNKYTVVPNIDISEGYDSVSGTGCLKLNFDGSVEPIWLGNESRQETIDVYLERLPARRKR